LHRLCAAVGPIEVCKFQHSDPVFGLDKLYELLSDVIDENGAIAVDISTFPRIALLLTLRVIDKLSIRAQTRLFYSEPKEYVRVENRDPAYGLTRLAAVPTFVAPYTANEELVLIAFLGYEGDRALGLWQSIEPHKTLAVLADPPYRSEWKGVAERLNAPLLASLDDSCVFRVDPRNPISTYRFLCETITSANWEAGTNFYIAPMGTKPETVGVFAFCRDYPDSATVIYCSPINHRHEYLSQGVGDVWELPYPERRE
jgi:hypothetical protein